MKKFFVLLLSGVILTSSVPMSSYAATNADPAKGNALAASGTLAGVSGGAVYDAIPISIKEEPPVKVVDPTNEALESAIKAVKAKITIPQEYSDFNYYFYNTSSYSDSYWSLTWSNPKDGSQLQVNCDQSNHITFYSKYNYNNKYSSIPAYLKKDLKSTADAFIKKVAPEISSNLEYVDATYDGIYSGNYIYSYSRIENGVTMPDNSASVSVNSVTGEVTNASFNWLYDTQIPSSAVKLTQEEAVKLIKENMTMKLVYRSDYYHIYDGIRSTDTHKAFLVYEPSLNYISIDAKTGKVYLTSSQWIDNAASNQGSKGDSGAGMASDSTASATEAPLTDEEITKIEELKNLISKDDAIKAVTSNKYLYLDKNLKSYTASLSKAYNGDENSYVWNVQLSDPREVNYEKDSDYYRAYASAQVDAKTGKILSFYSSMKSQYDEKTGKWNTVKVAYNKEKARTNLEKFLKSEVNARFNNSKLVDTHDDYIAYYKNNVPVYGGFNYQYNRVNQGVEFPDNGIFASVDGVTGKIYSFGCNWDDEVVFESPKGAMTADQAMDKYLSKDGYGLKYEINVLNSYDSKSTSNIYADYSVNYEVRLVYRPDINPAFISPFTGEQLNYNGEVYKETQPYRYLDIADTQANREILLLADMNIGFEGEYFNPDMNITVGELNDLLQKVGYGYYTQEDTNSQQLITREKIAQDFISNLGLEKVSALKDIYKTDFVDDSNIDQQYYGAVALAKGLGLMEADSNNYFNPKKNITRAEAVHLILNFIDVQKNGILW